MALSRKRRAVLKALTAVEELHVPTTFYRELWRAYVDLEREARASRRRPPTDELERPSTSEAWRLAHDAHEWGLDDFRAADPTAR